MNKLNIKFFNPKKAHPCLILHRLSKNPPKGLTWRWVSEKRHMPIKLFAYIWPICREASPKQKHKAPCYYVQAADTFQTLTGEMHYLVLQDVNVEVGRVPVLFNLSAQMISEW